MDGQATLSMYYAPESAQGCLSVGDLIMGNYELDENETKKEKLIQVPFYLLQFQTSVFYLPHNQIVVLRGGFMKAYLISL